MAGSGWLTPSNINEVFKELDTALEHEGEHVEMYIAGGARMILGLKTDRATKDIDGIIRSGRNALERAAKQVGARHGAEPGWINERMWTAMPQLNDTRAQTLYNGRHLKITGASPEHMLAMKLRATRTVDADDADAIIRLIDIRDTGSALAIAEKVYQADGNRARLEILKGVERLAQRQPQLARTHGPVRPTEAPQDGPPPNQPARHRESDGTANQRTETASSDDNRRQPRQPDHPRSKLKPANPDRIRIGGNPGDATPVRARKAEIGGKLKHDKATKETTEAPGDDNPSDYKR